MVVKAAIIEDKRIAKLESEVIMLRASLKAFMDFVGYNGQDYQTEVKPHNIDSTSVLAKQLRRIEKHYA